MSAGGQIELNRVQSSGKRRRIQSRGEEIANSVTHGIGVALSVAALSVLVVFASLQGDVWKIIGVSIYGSMLIFLYLASTLYHGFRNPKVKRLFQLLDHSSINLLIAGTYTPVTLVTLRGPWGWVLFGLIWALAISGILRDIFLRDLKFLAVVLYIGMGWLALIAIQPILGMAQPGLMIFMVGGGICYTAGVLFYAWKRFKFHHAVWHLFVLAGSIAHFFGILFYLDPKL